MRSRKFQIPASPPPPPMVGVHALIEGTKRNERFENNGCVWVYTDEKEGTETYVINDVYVKRVICSTDDEEAMFDKDNPGIPVSIRGLEKIQLSRPPTPPRAPFDDFDEVAERRDSRRIAEDALAYFNKKHNTDYKLVETQSKFAIYDSDGCWMHANFTAKPEAALDGGNGDSSTKLFFAEGKYFRGQYWLDFHYEITACCILDSKTSFNKSLALIRITLLVVNGIITH